MKTLNSERYYDSLDIEAFLNYHGIDDPDERQVVYDMFEEVGEDTFKMKDRIFN